MIIIPFLFQQSQQPKKCTFVNVVNITTYQGLMFGEFEVVGPVIFIDTMKPSFPSASMQNITQESFFCFFFSLFVFPSLFFSLSATESDRTAAGD